MLPVRVSPTRPPPTMFSGQRFLDNISFYSWLQAKGTDGYLEYNHKEYIEILIYIHGLDKQTKKSDNAAVSALQMGIFFYWLILKQEM